MPKDAVEAVKWYRKAAEQGDADAQFNLGVMYAKGEGVPQNHAEALKWFRLAADQGNARAQYNLGFMYAKGEGVLQNHVQAHKWFNLAAVAGYDDAAQCRADISDEMTAREIAEAQRRAREWLSAGSRRAA